MTKRIEEQAVVVTGASSGVGRAIARAFGVRHAKVALIARNAPALENATEEIRRAGGEAMALPLDVSDFAAVAEAGRAVVGRWGRIDTWINDAMVTVMSPVSEMKPEEYDRVTRVSYLGYVYGTMVALEHMRERDEGTIIQVGSALAYRSIPLQSAYCGAKAAIRGFTDSLRCELVHDHSHIKLTMLQLPAVNTPQFDVSRSRMGHTSQPVPPIYQPEVIAWAAVHAARHAPREVWIGESAVKAILGQKFIPGLLDYYLGRTGYKSQQTDEPARPRPDNLETFVPGDRGAHGRFDDRARPRSAKLWLRTHPAVLGASLGALAAVGYGVHALRA